MARFDGASAGSGFSTSAVTRWSRPWFEWIVGGFGADDAVPAGVLVRDLHDRHDRGVGLVVGMDQLADARPVADDDVVRQDHRERLVADEVLGHEDRVAEAELLLLADVRHLGQVADVADLPEHLDVALLLEQVLELVREVEVVLDRPLLAGGDDDDLLDPGGDGLLDRVLDDRLVDERQHLLRLRLRGRQEASAPAGGGEDGLANAHRTSGQRVGRDRPSIPCGSPRASRRGLTGDRRPAREGRRQRLARSSANRRTAQVERRRPVQVREMRGPRPGARSGRPGRPRGSPRWPSRKSRSSEPLRIRVGPG